MKSRTCTPNVKIPQWLSDLPAARQREHEWTAEKDACLIYAHENGKIGGRFVAEFSKQFGPHSASSITRRLRMLGCKK